MRNKVLILILISAFAFFSVKCGKTDLDLEWEEAILGKWKPVNSEGETLKTLPLYEFFEKGRGYTVQQGQTTIDSLNWEIKRGQLRVFYDKTPSGYYVAYDQYHTRSLYRIHEVEEDNIRLTMFLYNGFQREFTLIRMTEDDGMIED